MHLSAAAWQPPFDMFPVFIVDVCLQLHDSLLIELCSVLIVDVCFANQLCQTKTAGPGSAILYVVLQVPIALCIAGWFTMCPTAQPLP